MLRQLLKPCPRCRGNHLLELKEEDRHAVKCMHCGYFLLKSEMRFLLEDTVLHEFNQGVQAPIRSGPDSCLHEYEDGYIISSDCMDCGVCEYMCPQGAIFEAKRQFVINKALCNGCGDCVPYCPARAIVARRGFGERQSRTVRKVLTEALSR